MEESRDPGQLVGLAWGNAVRRARLRRGITQVDLSSRAIIPQSTISRIEAGKYGALTPEICLRLAVALEADVDDLFAWPVGINAISSLRYRTTP